ncbi:fungal hydrophobin [Rhodocollybia butyracea]|uniref:Hydrophobin n=1 Tax=Rhodocollybia butyracea TaxID=206335 RepID=A0A9P5U1E0_9AGAR|nr:fungal hydrophobin [Rhodocollybia butyracea]
MQLKLTFVSAALATLALASPAPRDEPASSCYTGPVQCCSSVQTASQAVADPFTLMLLGIVGIPVGNVTGLVGLTCSDISFDGGGTWQAIFQSSVCCTDNAMSGLISVGCVPVTFANF